MRIMTIKTFALLSTAIVGLSPASAQTVPADETGASSSEIIVTARKRGDEALQDIGGSIQAIGGELLQANGATGFEDYARRVPGLSANNSGSGQTQIVLRGAVSSRINHANPNVPETAGVYFGESSVTASGFNPDAGLVDIARVEVLRGPQGTLFGASAMAGVIRIVPNDPDPRKFSADAGFTTFATRKGAASYTGDLTLNVPIAENAAIRVSGYGLRRGGYIDNVYSGPANQGRKDYNSEDIFGVRGAILWSPDDSLTLKLSGVYQEIHADGRPDELRANDPLTGIGLQSRTSNGGRILFPGESVTITDELQVAKFVDETFDDAFALGAFQIDKDFGRVSVTSVTSYMDRRFENLLDDTYRVRDWINKANFEWFDIDGNPPVTAFSAPNLGVQGILNVGVNPLGPTGAVPVLRAPFENNTQLTRFAQEVRFVSDFEGPVNFLIGGYYEDETRNFQQDIIVPGLNAWIAKFYTTQSFGTNGASRADNFFEGRYSFKTRQLAAFGDVTGKLGDFELSVGGRFYDYKQKANIFFGGFIEFSEDRLEDSVSGSGFDPKVELLYKPTQDLTLFTGYSEGFRLGSVQQFIAGYCENDLRAAGALTAGQTRADIPTTIGSDSLKNYEAGFKANLFGKSTTLNATAYRIDWKNARSQVFLGCGFILEGNFTDIRSDGVEVNFASRLSDSLSVDVNFGYTDARVSAVRPGAQTIAKVGDRTPITPRVLLSGGIDYRGRGVLGDYDLLARADASYTSGAVGDLGTNAEQSTQGLISNLSIPASTVANAYLGIGNEQWSATLFVRNLTDERIITGVDIDRRSPAAFSRARPRNFGLILRYSM